MTDFIHTVFFWLRPDVDAARRADFVAGLSALAASPNVSSLHVGQPAGTPRDVVDNSWDYQIIATFAGRDAHDAYQSADDVAHQAFISAFSDCWTRVQVYDSVTPV